MAQLSCCCHREPQNQTWLSRLCLNPILGSWELAAPVIFGEEAELAHVWVLLWLPVSGGQANFSIMYLSRGGAAAVPACSPWEQIPVYTQPLEFLLGAQGLQGHCPGLLVELLCFPCSPHFGEFGDSVGSLGWDEQLSLGEAFPHVLLGSANSSDHPTLNLPRPSHIKLSLNLPTLNFAQTFPH